MHLFPKPDKKLGIMNPSVREEETRGFLSNFLPASRPSPSYSEISQLELAAFHSGRLQPRSLPCDVQKKILAHLPALKLMELEATCPSIWSPLLRCPTLKETWGQLHRGGRGRHNRERADVWVMRLSTGDETDAAQTSIAYIPAQKKYYLLAPMLLSPYVTSLDDPRLIQMKPLVEKSRLVGSSGPCVVFQSVKSNSMTDIHLDVYNTLTGGTQALPPLCLSMYGGGLQSSPLPIVITDTGRQTFCIIVETHSEEMACLDFPRCDLEPLCTLFVYDSTQHNAKWAYYPMGSIRGWRAMARACRRFRSLYSSSLDLPTGACDTSDASVNAMLQWAVRGDFFKYNQGSNTLYVWYKVQQEWCNFEVRYADGANSAFNTRESKVVKCGGHLLLVMPTVLNEWTGFSIWKLRSGSRPSTCEWEQISATPANLMWKTFGSLNPIYCADSRCLCIMPLASMEYLPPLVFVVQQDTWYNLPGLMKNVQTLCAMRLRFKMSGHN